MAAAKKRAAKTAEEDDDDSASSASGNGRTSALDNFIPTVRRVNEADLKARFTHQNLTPVEGEPTFESMQLVEEELAANSLTSKVSFGGGGIADASASYLAMRSFKQRLEKIGSSPHHRAHSLTSIQMTANKKRKWRFRNT